MIPVLMQTEPKGFIEKVNKPGKLFLRNTPSPNSNQWTGKDYWRRSLPDMRKAYKSICSYSANWIPHSTGNHSIDHFIPKSERPDLAYEWNNFRYVSARFNSRKGTKKILDPFNLDANFFVLNFTSFLIFPNPLLNEKQKQAAVETIICLKLNLDDDLVSERQEWYLSFHKNDISFNHLEKYSPFIAFELLRQGLYSQ